MSWFQAVVVDVEKGFHEIEGAIRKITHSQVAASNSNVPTPEAVAAAKEAAVAIAKAVTPPAGSQLSVSISGHQNVQGEVSPGDSVTASVIVVAKPAAPQA